MTRSQPCRICGVESAKYKFRCCSGLFCSPECFRQHSECTIADSRYQPNDENPNIRINNFDLNLAEEEVLSDESFSTIFRDDEILGMLSASRLRAIITRINHSRDRRRIFRKVYGSDSQFSRLVARIDTLLSDNTRSSDQ